MASNAKLAEYKYKIIDIQKVPYSFEYLIGVEIEHAGDKYHKAFRLNYDRPVSLEEFERDLKKQDLTNEKDPMQFLKAEINKDHSIKVVPPPIPKK
jgi:hypothetical protein